MPEDEPEAGPWRPSTARGLLGASDLGLAAQQEDPDSLLTTWADTYRRLPLFGSGACYSGAGPIGR